MNFKKGDLIQIITGKDRGKQGKISEANPSSGKILVQGLNQYKKHQRPKKQGDKGEIISVSRYFNASNAMLVCGSCGKPTRVGHRIEGEKKSRYCKKCNATN